MESKLGNSNESVSSPPAFVDIVREEEGPSGSAQQGPKPSTTIPVKLFSYRLKKGPVFSSQTSSSLRDVMKKAHDEVSSHSKFAFICEIKHDCQSDIDELVNKYCIPDLPYMCVIY